MISVIVYGRNDSYGYNLSKRAAISLNCIAQLLDDPDDEIIFVDCNTPDDIPTFPESIADTLTPQAKQLLRVLRIRPEQYERGRNGSKFKVLEPLCRNVAIRRSNPTNRWILNTNTDMVFTPLEEGTSLSHIVSELPDGFYELPRFEMPESLWESTNRTDPAVVINSFKTWGLRFHLNEIVTSSKELIFDGPGDFQLSLRSQLFQIHGMNEQMVLGWHVDSNLCKRMWLLNSETRTIIDRLHAFHCDHTRIQTVYHIAGKSSENSLADFFVNVETPSIPEQAYTWGMPDEEIEEIRLDERRAKRIQTTLEQILPGMERPITGLSTVNSFDVGLYYDNFHVLPYLADIIVNFSPKLQLAYIGCNVQLLGMLADLRLLLGHSGQILYLSELLQLQSPTIGCIPASWDVICKEPGSFIVDLSMKHLPSRLNDIGSPVPERCQEVVQFASEMSKLIIRLACHEKEVAGNNGLLRPAIFVGCHSTTFDEIIKTLFSCAMTPANTYVRNGVVTPDVFPKSPPIMPLHFYVIGNPLSDPDVVTWMSKHFSIPVNTDEVRLARTLYSMFLNSEEKQKALDALETLLSFDAGRGWLEMQIEISNINGVPEQGEELQKFIEGYEKRPYKM